MNITNEEIKVEFKRQVKLCQGIGKVEMFNIINDFYPPSEKEKPKEIAEQSEREEPKERHSGEEICNCTGRLEFTYEDHIIWCNKCRKRFLPKNCQ